MSENLHNRALAIARRAFRLPEAERGEYVRNACADERDGSELLAAVQELLRGGSLAPNSADGFDGLPDDPATLRRPEESAGEGSGAMIGRYKILQEIGEGGFGFVYMAQQSHPIKRKVALKIVKPGMDTRQVIGRFETERQALAMMDHPNIAKVLDAGETESGRPYFVMELVRGVPITEYCDSNNLTTAQRLALFQQVCHAVLHAHQKGIIHRDIKPSNVMVTLHDGEPVPKVIDFGIAKATGSELTDKTVFTEYRHFIGTPEYMSPEQAAMSGLDVDTRSDIYSLGVLLYELLSGMTPFDPLKLRSAGYAEIQRIIRDEDPPKPSTRISKAATAKGGAGDPSVFRTGSASALRVAATSASDIAKRRRTDPASLRRTLAGDLDWIVMKAMEKDRTRRYGSAGAFAEDIRRYLHNEPIMARPPTAAYRFRKFARRNKGLITGGGVLLAALLLTIAALAYSFIQVSRERDRTAERETMTRAEMLLTTMNSVRRYTADHVRPALAAAHPGDFVKESVPGYSARTVFEDFKTNDAYKSFLYKEASDNPTNVKNRADSFELDLLRQFRVGEIGGRELSGIRVTDGRREFYIARPMVVYDPKCLDCHTTPEVAPTKQVEYYGREGGYGWKLNDIIAAQVVYVPVSEAFRADSHNTTLVVAAAAGVLMLLAVGGIVLLRQA